MRVAYFGPEGTYTEAATVKQFGHFVQTSPMASIDEVFREVESGVCDYGVVPVENSTEGMVNHTLDCLLNTNARVCAEVELPIHHALMRAKEASLDRKVSKIVSHAQSLAQCRAWLDQHYPGVREWRLPVMQRQPSKLPQIPVCSLSQARWLPTATICGFWPPA